ncbi:protein OVEREXPRESSOR OF CATIONIC PEROXIDASE 3-like [Vicia villosa]|uniref:protein OVEREXPRESSOR OF CATIONIC PEROXIDASE 3-like n=1 Tax=Vicia villosa TaxID=3911 RepID=UPI00273ACC17|nr:protein OVEREXPRESSOR OF CATIONIC PEROXIDASE 3-like [Vicia villosa]
MSNHCLSSAHFLTIGATRSFPSQRKPFLFSVPLSPRSRNLHSSIVTATPKKKNKKKLTPVTEENEEEEDAFELLFKQLEEDLKKDDSSMDDFGDEISEEDMALLERELEGVLGDFDGELLNSDTAETPAANEAEKTSKLGNDDLLNLRTWQLNKLARALKTGRRKLSIKTLAAELCLDRALVLNLLRNPPPNLLMMSLSIPDEPTPSAISTPGENFYQETSADNAESEPKSNIPIHTMQENWSSRKRLKKAHLDTLERVYMRSKRPTNAMISNIVQVTNLPRKTVIKWFEDKRAEDGVPKQRLPYQLSTNETD